MASSSSSSSSAGVEIVDDIILEELATVQEEDDACSICLETFSAVDPSTITECKHEYHLHCILEWSQRSKECPICWQSLALKDPVSQELLVAAGTGRNSRLTGNVRQTHEEATYMDDNDYETEYYRRLYSQPYTGTPQDTDHETEYYRRLYSQHPDADYEEEYYRRLYSQPHTGTPQDSSVTSADMSNMQQTSDLQGECPIIGGVNSAEFSSSSEFRPVTIGASSNSNIRDRLLKSSSPSIDGSRRSSSSELLAISNSIRSKLLAASTRCKESISKGTSGFKEKLLARNTTVKELGREVQREMNAGIAGVAKMIERIDLSSKRTGPSTPVSSCKVETSNFGNKGKGVQEDIIRAQAPGQTIVLSTEMLSSDSSSLASQKTYSLVTSPAQVRE